MTGWMIFSNPVLKPVRVSLSFDLHSTSRKQQQSLRAHSNNFTPWKVTNYTLVKQIQGVFSQSNVKVGIGTKRQKKEWHCFKYISRFFSWYEISNWATKFKITQSMIKSYYLTPQSCGWHPPQQDHCFHSLPFAFGGLGHEPLHKRATLVVPFCLYRWEGCQTPPWKCRCF